MHQASSTPATHDLVLVGGGHTHALVLRSWAMAPLGQVRLTLIDPNPMAPYTGMLPGLIAGHYRREEIEIDLWRLSRMAGGRIIGGRVEAIDRAARTVTVAGRPPIGYDLLSLDIGITSDLPQIPGFSEHGVAAKPMARLATAWEAFVARLTPDHPAPPVAVIGGGLAGFELALAARHRIREITGHPARIALLEAGAQVLSQIAAPMRARLLGHLRDAGIEVMTDGRVTRITAETVELADGRMIPAALVITAAGARPQGWLAQTGLDLVDGFVRVGPTLRSFSDPAIFAVGDCSHLDHAPRPKAGVFAVRAAPVLFHNLRAVVLGGRLRSFAPQRDYLKLAATGGRHAVGEKWGFAREGDWLWRMKDRIDRRFMAGFLPRSPHHQPRRTDRNGPAVQPLCGGCGAKVGAPALHAVLEDLPVLRRPDVLTGAGDDAAILDLGDGRRQVLSVDHLRAFTADPWTMGRLAAIHALGDIWAMGASPQAALANLVLPEMAEPMQRRTLSEIMAGAGEVFAAEGAAIVGGHSGLGAEMSVGFTVTGLLDTPGCPKGPLHPGLALILTKPLGTGTVLAAEMALAAPPGLVAATLAEMAVGQSTAAAILAPHAVAMTDVTGFGLAGHLAEMLTGATGTRARLSPDDLPLLDGVEALAAAGHASTIAPANRATLADLCTLPETPRGALLVDPQTCGGLLAAVPADRADGLVARLREAGHAAAAVIGRTEPAASGSHSPAILFDPAN